MHYAVQPFGFFRPVVPQQRPALCRQPTGGIYFSCISYAKERLDEETVEGGKRVGCVHIRSVLDAKIFLGHRAHRLRFPRRLPNQVDIDVLHLVDFFQPLLDTALDHV